MKVKQTSIHDLEKIYTHPSAVLFRSIELRTVYERTKKYVLKQPSVDIGSGDGKISHLLFDNKFTFGIDNGEANDYQFAIDNKFYSKVLLESAEKMSIKNNSVNFVFSNSVIEHIPNVDKVLAEVHRILTRRGRFIFTAPSVHFSKGLFGAEYFNNMGIPFLANQYIYWRNKKLNHYHLYSHLIWKRLLHKYRLRMVDHAYYISDETLRLWDKMALEVVTKKIIGRNEAERDTFRKYKNKIHQRYRLEKSNNSRGASLFISCEKVL